MRVVQVRGRDVRYANYRSGRARGAALMHMVMTLGYSAQFDLPDFEEVDDMLSGHTAGSWSGPTAKCRLSGDPDKLATPVGRVKVAEVLIKAREGGHAGAADR